MLYETNAARHVMRYRQMIHTMSQLVGQAEPTNPKTSCHFVERTTQHGTPTDPADFLKNLKALEDGLLNGNDSISSRKL